MTAIKTPNVGAITWMDLTVQNADAVKDFYKAVVGWDSSEVDMESHQDYCMNRPADGLTSAGICHARGENADLPPQWLIYITVADLDASLLACLQRGGKILRPARTIGEGRMAVIEDPAGAVAALFVPGS